MNAAEGSTVLIIEDEQKVLLTISALLERRGFAVLHASGGAEGIAMAGQHLPDVIVTDLAMPGVSGFDVLESLHSDEKLRLIPVIVITAKLARADMRRGMDLGADDFITKPFSADELVQSIQARLEKKSLLDELDAFAHTVAHDLRSPLSTLKGRIELARMMMQRGDHERATHNLDALQESADRLNSIVDEILLLAGLRREKIAPTPIDMAEVVNEALLRVEHVMRSAEARITLPETWPAVTGFAPWLVHIWTNLLTNAAKYGGKPPRIDITATTLPDGKAARFAVRDHGPGLDPESKASLFTTFTDVAMRHAKGHGLGLSIVRRIVAKHQGRVGVESEPGQGTEFWFELPNAAPAALATSPS